MSMQGVRLAPLANKGKENLNEGTDDWSIPEIVKSNPLFVEIGTGNIIDALKKLDKTIRDMNLGNLISAKIANPFLGRSVKAGNYGLWDNAGKPLISLSPGNFIVQILTLYVIGRYINLNPACSWKGSYDLTSQIEELGLTIAQVGQGEAMVIQDPQNRIFVLRNGGFVSFGAFGSFKVLAIVDILNLGDENAVREKDGEQKILGWKKDVKSSIGGTHVTVATFFNVPANNVVILQNGSSIFSLSGGQHLITNPHTTYRRFYSLSERQYSFKTQPAYTIEGVPVILDLNLRYRIFDPVTLTLHYDGPLAALLSPCQTAVNAVVSRLSYQQFMRASKIEGDVPDNGHVHWLESFRMDCMSQLAELSRGHGVEILSFEVMDRRLEGQLGKDLEKQAEIVLQNQMEATQIELKNHINTEKQKGLLAVAKVEQDTKRNIAETEFFLATKKADAKYYETMKQAQAEAEASALATLQQAKNIIALAEARKREVELQGESYALVPHGHAQEIQKSMIEVEMRKALPPSTVWFQGQIPGDVASGYNTAKGVSLAHGK